jgi:hypothetical protein
MAGPSRRRSRTSLRDVWERNPTEIRLQCRCVARFQDAASPVASASDTLLPNKMLSDDAALIRHWSIARFHLTTMGMPKLGSSPHRFVAWLAPGEGAALFFCTVLNYACPDKRKKAGSLEPKHLTCTPKGGRHRPLLIPGPALGRLAEEERTSLAHSARRASTAGLPCRASPRQQEDRQ